MRLLRTRAVAALAATATAGTLAFAFPTAAQAAAAPDVRITEWMYSPGSTGAEFVEFTNLGTTSVSLAGWSFDDDSETPGTVALDSLGTLAPGGGQRKGPAGRIRRGLARSRVRLRRP